MTLKLRYPIESLLRYGKQYPALAPSLTVLGLLVICGLAFWWQLGSTGLIDETEPLFAEAARQMTVTGDWVTPYFNGATRFDKPPLVYWLMAIAYQTIGVNEWAVRFPSALAATVLTVASFATLRVFGVSSPAVAQDPGQAATQRRWVPWIGAAMMAFNLQTLVWARTGVSDMLLSGCMGTALLSFFWGYAAAPGWPKRLGYLGFYVFCGLAVLAKGPVGIVIPGLVVVLFLAYVGQLWAALKESGVWWGMPLFLAIALPWFGLVIQANGQDYIDSFFGYHNFERFTEVVNRHAAPWYFYFVVVLAGFAPYSLYLPVAIARLRVWRWADWRSQPRTTHLGIFACTWFAVIFLFFTIAVTKLPSYVLPLIPAAGILVALAWGEMLVQPQPSGKAWGIVQGLSVLFLLGMGCGMLVLPRFLGTDLATPDFPTAMWQSGVPWVGASLWGIGAIATLLLLMRRQGRWVWAIHLSTYALFIALAVTPALAVADAQRQLPIRQMATEILQQQRPGESIMMIGFAKPSLVFYTQQRVRFIRNSEDANKVFEAQTDKPPSSALVLGLRYRILESDLRRNEFTDLKRIGKYSLVRVEFPIPRYRQRRP